MGRSRRVGRSRWLATCSTATRAVATLAALLLLASCAFLRPAAQDAPIPATLRTAVEPARQALLDRWPHPESVSFRFVAARCAIGAEVALVFEQRAPDRPAAFALALADDIASGALFGAFGLHYDVSDPAAQPDLVAMLEGREFVCP